MRVEEQLGQRDQLRRAVPAVAAVNDDGHRHARAGRLEDEVADPHRAGEERGDVVQPPRVQHLVEQLQLGLLLRQPFAAVRTRRLNGIVGPCDAPVGSWRAQVSKLHQTFQ